MSLVVLAVAAVVYGYLAPRLIDSIYRHESWPPLHRLVPHPVRHSVEHYYLRGRQVCARLVVVGLLLELTALAARFRRRIARFLRDFFADFPRTR